MANRELTQADVRAGQRWRRPNGTVLTLDHVAKGYAIYWLASGSRPQYRDIRLGMLLKRYTLVASEDMK